MSRKNAKMKRLSTAKNAENAKGFFKVGVSVSAVARYLQITLIDKYPVVVVTLR